jgi:serine protease Do
MKTRNSPFFFLLALVFAIACGGTAGLTLWAADTKAPPAKNEKNAKTAATEKAKPADDKRPPLRINVDKKSINRDAADRVSYAPIVKRTAASVVYVYSSRKVKAQDISPFLNDPLFRRFFPDLPEDGDGSADQGLGSGRSGRNRDKGGSGKSVPRGKSGKSRVPEQTQQGLGSGVIVTADGYIITNNHVVEDADDVKVSIGESNHRYEAKIIGRDEMSDVAVLRIDASNLTPAVFADSDQLQVGDVVLAIGNPFGVGQSVSRGIVSALSRGGIAGPFEDFIQTDAAINPGNSGGALLDTDGRVVGINSAIITGSGSFAGVGFAIPINLVRTIAEQLVNTGRVERGFLGVGPQDLTEDLIAQFGTETGALITEVTDESPAQKAGLKPGDVITKVNNVAIRDARHLLLTIAQTPPNTEIALEYLRDKKTQTAKVKLARRDEDLLARNDRRTTPDGGKDVGVLNGVGVGDITSQLRDQLGLPSRIKGAIITSVEPDSPSGKQGLREGDIILDLNGKEVGNAEEAVKASEEIKGPKVLVRVWRNGRPRYIGIDESKE